MTRQKKRRIQKDGGHGIRPGILILLLACLSAVAYLHLPFASLSGDSSAPNLTRPGEALATISPAADDRGGIYDRRYRALAVTGNTTAVYVRPLEMTNPEKEVRRLAGILDLEEEAILRRIKSERGFVWLGRELAPEQTREIAALKLPGVYMVDDHRRRYPLGTTAAHIVGFARNGLGLDGIEFQYEALLKGGEFMDTADLTMLQEDAGRHLSAGGMDLILTLDLRGQKILEEFLAVISRQSQADSSLGILLETTTGAVRAMASQPAYDPNRFWEFNEAARTNQALNRPVRLGELNALFCRVADIEQQLSAPAAEGDAPPIRAIGPRRVKLRINAPVPVIDYPAPERLTALANRLGLHAPPAIDLPLAEAGIPETVPALNDPEAAVTPLQLLLAVNALINDGRSPRPHLLDRVRDRDGKREFTTDFSGTPQTVVGAETSESIRHWLIRHWPVRKDTLLISSFMPGKPAGTEKKSFSHAAPGAGQQYLLAFYPAEDPQLSLLVVVNGTPDTATAGRDGNEPPLTLMSRTLLSRLDTALAEELDKGVVPDYWLGKNVETTKEGPAAEPDLQELRRKMPSVTGKSLRSALQTLQYLDLKVSLHGSGRVVAQQPTAGTILPQMGECSLELAPEPGAADRTAALP